MNPLTDGVYVLTCDEDRYTAFVQRQEVQGYLLGEPTKWTGTRTSDPITACRRGHRDILKDAADKGLNSVLILEDDAIFKDTIRDDLSKVINTDWDAIWLGGRYSNLKDIQGILHKVEKVFTTHSYLLKGCISGAYEFLCTSDLASDVALMQFLSDKNVYVTVPRLAGQLQGWSDVLKKERGERW